MANTSGQVRIIYEKGQIFADINPVIEDGVWIDLGILIEFFTGEKFKYIFPMGTINDDVVNEQLKFISNAIIEHWSDINNLCRSKHDSELMKSILEFRHQVLEERMHPKKG